MTSTATAIPEYYLTSQAANRLQTLAAGPAQPAYRDIGLKARRERITAVHRRRHASLDGVASGVRRMSITMGSIDLFVSKGNVSAQLDYAQQDPSDLFLGHPDGTFHDVADSAGILNFYRGRGAALADFNMDGLLDLVEVNYGAPTRLWRNLGSGDARHPAPMGNWLSLGISEPGTNRDAIGVLGGGQGRRPGCSDES